MNLVKKILLKRAEDRGLLNTVSQFRQGDEVRVHAKVKEGQKERIQVFQGVVIKLQGKGMTRAFTVRKMSFGVGVERTFPFNSTKLVKVEVVKRAKTRQSRLYYLRSLTGRAARLKSELVTPDAKEKTPKAKKAKKTETATETASE